MIILSLNYFFAFTDYIWLFTDSGGKMAGATVDTDEQSLYFVQQAQQFPMKVPLQFDEYQKPPLKWKELFWVLLIIFFLDTQLRDLLKAKSVAKFISSYNDPHMLMLQFTIFLTFVFFCYCTYFILHCFYDSLKNWQIILLVIIVAILGILLRAMLEEVIVKAITGIGNYNPKTSWSFYFRDNSIYAITYCGLAAVFFFVHYAAFHAKLYRQSQLQRREAELNFLRSQVNPHFLFNTLNNLYAMVNRGSDKALPTLEKLSGLPRYSLYEQQRLVPIQREINYLKDLVHLESLRIDTDVPIIFEVGAFPDNQQLPPLLLVPFVENAFKHGALKNPEFPLRIVLKARRGGGLDFEVANMVSKEKRSKDGNGGIGILNVKKRLALLYPNQHQLDIKIDDNSYTVQLSIYA